MVNWIDAHEEEFQKHVVEVAYTAFIKGQMSRKNILKALEAASRWSASGCIFAFDLLPKIEYSKTGGRRK